MDHNKTRLDEKNEKDEWYSIFIGNFLQKKKNEIKIKTMNRSFVVVVVFGTLYE